jgi:hypothetical protein
MSVAIVKHTHPTSTLGRATLVKDYLDLVAFQSLGQSTRDECVLFISRERGSFVSFSILARCT